MIRAWEKLQTDTYKIYNMYNLLVLVEETITFVISFFYFLKLFCDKRGRRGKCRVKSIDLVRRNGGLT